jgi:hypothetical protein
VKRQVFLFLSIFSFFAYSMNYRLLNKITNQDIVYALDWYCSQFPDFVNKDVAKQERQRILTTPLTFKDKKEIVEKMREFPFPKNLEVIGDRVFLSESNGYEAKSTTY